PARAARQRKPGMEADRQGDGRGGGAARRGGPSQALRAPQGEAASPRARGRRAEMRSYSREPDALKAGGAAPPRPAPAPPRAAALPRGGGAKARERPPLSRRAHRRARR